MYFADTIAAICTPLGEGGVGIIRVSGPESLQILKILFRPIHNGGFQSHRFCYGTIYMPGTNICIDEVFTVFMKNPKTYTREDVVEIQCHGGTLVLQQILDQVLCAGARLAAPGEFTRRAFLNGRIDLLQAEAIIDLIRGKTDASVALAQHQREGILSEQLAMIRDSVRQALALVEAYVDFPDDDLGEVDTQHLQSFATKAVSMASALVASFAEGKVLREGVSVVIAGKPNVGKSSLLNTLLKEKRSIVTSVPGTTRDLIEEVVNIRGLPVKLLDTAGIRISDDPVEQEGIRLALERIKIADLVVFLLDGSSVFDDDDMLVLKTLVSKQCLVVFNKSDLQKISFPPTDLESFPQVTISTLTGHGIDQLKNSIADRFLHGKTVDNRDTVMLSQVRHRDALMRTVVSLETFLANLGHISPHEVLALDLRDALDSLGLITGETTPDDILDLVFSQFCIGK